MKTKDYFRHSPHSETHFREVNKAVDFVFLADVAFTLESFFICSVALGGARSETPSMSGYLR